MKRLIVAAAVVVGLFSPASAHHYGHRHTGHYGLTASPELVTQVAVENGISPALAHAVVRKESGYRCGVRNGVMQTNPATARSMGVYGSLSDCRNGLVAGMRYLKESIRQHGNGCAAFSAYQSGLLVHRCSAYGRSIQAMMGHGVPRATLAYAEPAQAPAIASIFPALGGDMVASYGGYHGHRHHRIAVHHYRHYARHHYRHYAYR